MHSEKFNNKINNLKEHNKRLSYNYFTKFETINNLLNVVIKKKELIRGSFGNYNAKTVFIVNFDKTSDKVIDLIRECYNLDFYLIVYTCSNKDRYKHIEQYLTKNNIPFNSINENSPDINFAHGKLYYNILLDDRAGLSSAYESLKECIKYIKQGR